MPVDPAAQRLLDGMAQAPARSGTAEISVEQMRAGYDMLAALGRPAGEAPSTEDTSLPGPAGDIPVRIYRPQAAGVHPVVVYIHGGGFTIGSIASHDPLCQQIAAGVPAVVVSVDYRLAPESKFPAAVEDCWAAVQWVAAHAADLGGDPSRVAVAGDSAGGNLAAVCALKARDAGGPALAFQLLIYPTTDATGSFPSIQENGKGYFLTEETMRWFQENYLSPEDDRRHPDASPYFVEDLSGLAPAFVVTAEYDPLRDEGEAYGRRLEEAGVPTKVKRYDGMIHAFFQMDAAIPAGAEAISDSIEALRQALG